MIRALLMSSSRKDSLGYLEHAGEQMHVVRRPDGSVRYLDVATFIYTRTPYDPDAPIPGGLPG